MNPRKNYPSLVEIERVLDLIISVDQPADLKFGRESSNLEITIATRVHYLLQDLNASNVSAQERNAVLDWATVMVVQWVGGITQEDAREFLTQFPMRVNAKSRKPIGEDGWRKAILRGSRVIESKPSLELTARLLRNDAVAYQKTRWMRRRYALSELFRDTKTRVLRLLNKTASMKRSD
jgi:hypothetical protein